MDWIRRRFEGLVNDGDHGEHESPIQSTAQPDKKRPRKDDDKRGTRALRRRISRPSTIFDVATSRESFDRAEPSYETEDQGGFALGESSEARSRSRLKPQSSLRRSSHPGLRKVIQQQQPIFERIGNARAAIRQVNRELGDCLDGAQAIGVQHVPKYESVNKAVHRLISAVSYLDYALVGNEVKSRGVEEHMNPLVDTSQNPSIAIEHTTRKTTNPYTRNLNTATVGESAALMSDVEELGTVQAPESSLYREATDPRSRELYTAMEDDSELMPGYESKTSQPRFTAAQKLKAKATVPLEESPNMPQASGTTGAQPKKPTGSTRASGELPGVDDPQTWDTSPIKLAHQAIQKAKKHGNGIGVYAQAAKAITNSIKEPAYACHGSELRDGVWSVMNKVSRFAFKYAGFQLPEDYNPAELYETFGNMSPATVKIIEYVASGGPGGQDGWKQLFLNEQKRRAIVCAIIGNVLVEQVFQHPCFGGDEDILAQLCDVQAELASEDGFVRNKRYAEIIDAYLSPEHGVAASERGPGSMHVPYSFQTQVAAVIQAITIHLQPILDINPDHDPIDVGTMSSDLGDIVIPIGLYSLQMRMDPHSVYYFPPLFKEDDFIYAYMDCFNRQDMFHTNPRHKEKVWPPSYTEDDIWAAREEEALTQIIIMYGITTYRKGGWETPDSPMWEPIYTHDHDQAAQKQGIPNLNERPMIREQKGEDMGVRSHVLCPGWVLCRWGRKRVFDKRGKPIDNPVIHGKQWRDPGFVEFRAVEGVLEQQRDENSRPSTRRANRRPTSAGNGRVKSRTRKSKSKRPAAATPASATRPSGSY